MHLETQMSTKTTEWTHLQLELLHSIYATTPWAELESIFGRSRIAICRMANRSGLQRIDTRPEPWPLEDWEKLQEIYATTSWPELESIFSRSKIAIYRKASRAGLQRTDTHPDAWTSEDLKRLHAIYATTSWSELERIFCRTERAILRRAKRSGLEREDAKLPGTPKKPFKRWSQGEIMTLIEFYGKIAASEIANILGRAPTAVKTKASQLRIQERRDFAFTVDESPEARQLQVIKKQFKTALKKIENSHLMKSGKINHGNNARQP